MTSEAEETFLLHCKVESLPVPDREYRFHAQRKWRFDFAWPSNQVAVEIEGGIHSGGRHTRGKGFEEDCHKYNCATLLGWRVFRFTPFMVRSLLAVSLTKQALARFPSE